mmetsp:Transcript_3271/g.4535  ORF Transcript_3271/g.4535 Transcript_3271/m.4535 type:complete len:465 (+) Transcript_3271:136-1530(+)|eukprot:CAMPEP_0197291460 /NCGR_PEP_ID=MMETSP0890-20130614/15531_1 /TAXON_ID=44058 ORGANISM="Aureoumbra lagunensis, Strain CCMP1510" /NCGR_SAMPLE_ID=MMETSP0890 /ASSEMBLY_ACC=CAM_ASM_000533 /LENGTH=464 /DNA_ID=CAMNT_0042764475 /DNA_START=58 /DNA_END=1452 /DNA_ORIENTATION=-
MPAATSDHHQVRRASRRVVEDATRNVAEVLRLLEEGELSVDDVGGSSLRRLVGLLDVARARVERACVLGGAHRKDLLATDENDIWACSSLKTVTEDDEEENMTIGGFNMDEDDDDTCFRDDGGSDAGREEEHDDEDRKSDTEEKVEEKFHENYSDEDEDNGARLLSMRTLSTILSDDENQSEEPACRRRKLTPQNDPNTLVSPLQEISFRKGNKRSSKLKSSIEPVRKAKRRRPPSDEKDNESKKQISEKKLNILPPPPRSSSTLFIPSSSSEPNSPQHHSVVSVQNSISILSTPTVEALDNVARVQEKQNDPNPSLGQLGNFPPEVLLAIVATLNARELGRFECCCRATRGTPGIVDLAVLRIKRFQYGVKSLPLLSRETWPKVLQRWEWTRSSRSLTTRIDGVVAILRTTSIDSQFTQQPRRNQQQPPVFPPLPTTPVIWETFAPQQQQQHDDDVENEDPAL